MLVLAGAVVVVRTDAVGTPKPNTGGADSKPAILKSGANIVAIGTDWVTRDYYKQMNFTQSWLDNHGIVLIYLPDSRNLISTTEIKERVNNV